MNLAEAEGWHSADGDGALWWLLWQQWALFGVTHCHVARSEIVVDLAESGPDGAQPVIGVPMIRERLRLPLGLRLIPPTEPQPDAAGRLWWSGEGWLDEQSRTVVGPVPVSVLEQEMVE